MGEFKSDSSVKRTRTNAIYTALRFGVYALAGVFFVPFLVKQYGSGTYGLIALAGFLTQYVGLISGCIGSSVSRFLNVALNKNDWQQANEIFNTALVANLGFILIQLPLFVLGTWKLDWLIDFPPEIATDFRILVSCNVAIFFLDIMKGAFFTPMYAANRLDIGESFNIGSQLLRLALLFFGITWLGPWLWIIGAVDLGVSLLTFAIGLLVYRKLVHRSLVFRKKFVTRKWVRPVMSMAGWVLVAELGQVLFLKTDVWIINRFVGIEQAGICAALLLWPNFVQQIAKNVSAVIIPVILIDYANDRLARIRAIVLLSSRLFAIMSLVVCGLVLCFGDWLLVVWMGEDYRQYHWLLILMLLHFPLTLTREAYWPVFPAFNKMEYIGVSQLASGLLNVVLSIAFVFLGYGLDGVVVATAISLVLQRTFLLSVFVGKLLEFPVRQYAWIHAPGAVLAVAVLAQKYIFQAQHFYVAGACAIGMGILLLARLWLHDDSVKSLVVSLLRKSA